MVTRRTASSLVVMSCILGLATPAIVHAEPVDWATSGGSLFATASLPINDFMIDPPRPMPMPALPPSPVQRRAEAPQSPATRNPSRVQAHDTPSTDEYGEVRLLPSNQPLDALITKIATETGIDPKLLHALVIIESAYNTRAVSPVGAMGLTQLMPGTARELGVSNAFDTEQNLRAGARYLAIQIGRFSDIRLALAAYNSGPGRVARLGRVPDINETQNYVRDGIDCYLALTAGRGIRNRSQCRTSRGR
jgi:soluble lytic murein transglycosylase-like protein